MASEYWGGYAGFLIVLLTRDDSFRLLKYLHNSEVGKSSQSGEQISVDFALNASLAINY